MHLSYGIGEPVCHVAVISLANLGEKKFATDEKLKIKVKIQGIKVQASKHQRISKMAEERAPISEGE